MDVMLNPGVEQPARNGEQAGRKIAIVGCGAFSELFYAPAIADFRSRGVEISLLFDPAEARRAALKAVCPGAREASNFESVLDSDIDLAIVASPPRFHCEQ